MKISAAVLREVSTPFTIETLTLAEPHAGEVLVELRAAGVCHSDWHVMTGATGHSLPCVLGHEGSGIVRQVGDGVTRIAVGDHVALNWAPSCGGCFYCLRERPSLCGTYTEPIWAGTMMDGSTRLSDGDDPVFHFSALACFADHAVVPQECCVPMPDGIPFPISAVIGCAVTTGVGAVLNTARVEPGSSVVVFGAGGVGLCSVMGAQLAGASTIIAVDRATAKLELAKEFGATHGLAADEHLIEGIRELTGGRGADYVFEAIGIPSVQEQCLDAVRPGGTIVLEGVAPMGSGTNFPGALLTRHEKTVMGCYYGTANTARDFPLYADLYAKGRLDLDRLISRRYPLAQINEAYAEMLTGGVARSVIEW